MYIRGYGVGGRGDRTSIEPRLILEHFEGLKNPPDTRAKRRQLQDIIVITICGADNWVEVEEFGNAKGDWPSRFLGPPNGIPSHDTFGRVFSRLDPEQFGACFLNWVKSVVQLTRGQVAAVDASL